MDPRNGIGYVQKKSTLNSAGGVTNYASDQLIYKMFFDDNLFGNILLAYGNTIYGGSELAIFALSEMRIISFIEKPQMIKKILMWSIW